MLRITRTHLAGQQETLKVEGKLVGPWVEALRQACAGTQPCLDLAAVDFADAAGLSLLRELLATGASIASCSALVAELLHAEER